MRRSKIEYEMKVENDERRVFLVTVLITEVFAFRIFYFVQALFDAKLLTGREDAVKGDRSCLFHHVHLIKLHCFELECLGNGELMRDLIIRIKFEKRGILYQRSILGPKGNVESS